MVHNSNKAYSMVLSVGFLRFGEGTLQPVVQKLQNIEIPEEIEGSGARLYIFQKK